MTIFGWDMSHYDSPSIGNAIDQGIAFVTHKAGGDQADGDLAVWWSGVRGHRDQLLLGAYWVLYPGRPEARADEFLARLDDQCPGWRDGPFILQADCEKWRNDSSTVPHLVEIRSFCDRLAAKVPKLKPIVYAPDWVYGDNLRGLGYPLWASTYVTGSGGFRALYPGDSSARWAAYSGQVPAILQYSSSAVIGGQTTSDANAYRGTLAELTALVAPGWSTEMDLTGKNLTDIAQAVASKLHVDYLTPASGLYADQTASEKRIVTAVTTAVTAATASIDSAIAAVGRPDPAALAQAIAAAIPADLAAKVADVLAQRLSA